MILYYCAVLSCWFILFSPSTGRYCERQNNVYLVVMISGHFTTDKKFYQGGNGVLWIVCYCNNSKMSATVVSV